MSSRNVTGDCEMLFVSEMDDPDRPLKDYGSFVHVQPSEADIAGNV